MVLFISSSLLSNALFGFRKKKKEQKEKEKAQQNVFAGMQELSRTMQAGPDAVREAMAMLDDPEMKAEVDKMMKDPEFQREINRLQNDPRVIDSMQEIQAQMESQPGGIQGVTRQAERDLASAHVRAPSGASAAEVGMAELQRIANNPAEMKKTLDMLNDPEVQAEVQRMMKDPNFQVG